MEMVVVRRGEEKEQKKGVRKQGMILNLLLPGWDKNGQEEKM